MVRKANWRIGSFGLLLPKRQAHPGARQGGKNGRALRLLSRVLGAARGLKPVGIVRAGELRDRLEAHPEIASVQVVYWSEVVEMSEVRNEVNEQVRSAGCIL